MLSKMKQNLITFWSPKCSKTAREAIIFLSSRRQKIGRHAQNNGPGTRPWPRQMVRKTLKTCIKSDTQWCRTKKAQKIIKNWSPRGENLSGARRNIWVAGRKSWRPAETITPAIRRGQLGSRARLGWNFVKCHKVLKRRCPFFCTFFFGSHLTPHFLRAGGLIISTCEPKNW